MRSKTDLFHLIKSLSKSEKRYFTLDAQKSGRQASRYLSLFRAISKQEEYDEAPLKTEFGRSLPDDKARLYEAILRALRDYRAAQSRAARLKEMVLDARFLYERGLYDQAEERLAGAKALAGELDDCLALLDINKEERRLYNERARVREEERLDVLLREKDRAIEVLTEELHLLDWHDRLNLQLIRNTQGLDAERRERLRREFAPLLERQVLPESVQGRLRYFQSLAYLHQLLGQSDKVYEAFQSVAGVWNQYPHYKEEEFSRYLHDAFNRLAAVLSSPEHVHETPELIKELEREKGGNWQDRKVLFQRTAGFRLVYYINYGKIADTDEILRPIEEGLEQFDLHPGAELTIRFNAAVLLLIAGQQADCVQWIDMLLERGKQSAVRQDIQNAARFIRLLALLQLEDFDAIENALRAAQRHFSRQPAGAIRDFSLQVIPYLRQWSAAPPGEERKVLLDLKEQVLQAQPAQPVPLGLDELLRAWIDSQVQRRPLLQTLRRQA